MMPWWNHGVPPALAKGPSFPSGRRAFPVWPVPAYATLATRT
jgi:hypothetical protein